MNYIEVIERWRALPDEQQRQRRWSAIPRQVADSMAFEGEPVDETWLKTLHAQKAPLVGSKPNVESFRSLS